MIISTKPSRWSLPNDDHLDYLKVFEIISFLSFVCGRKLFFISILANIKLILALWTAKHNV